MIFVTVGNGEFDPLIKELDRLVKEKKIQEEVIIQTGLGKYQPKHCKSFPFESPLTPYYQKASLIISHGGPGIVFEVLRLNKKLIALPNRDRTDPRHQVEFLQGLAQETTAFIYCPKVELIEEFLKKAKTHRFETYKPKPSTMHEVINNFLGRAK